MVKVFNLYYLAVYLVQLQPNSVSIAVTMYITVCGLFVANENEFPPLSEAQLNKLRHLTIISLANKNKVTLIRMFTW